MEKIISRTLTPEIRQLRIEVFMGEQGFSYEFDETDPAATHMALRDGETIVAVCRVFPGDAPGQWLLGRLAVRKCRRGEGLGAAMVRTAEDWIREQAPGPETELRLHAQCHAAGFYEKLGYTPFGDVEEEEGCPHIWMQKRLNA